MRAIRGELPPPAGVGWLLDPASTDITLTTSHPVFGARRYPLTATRGMIRGVDDAQLELVLTLACPGTHVTTPVMIRSESVSRPDLFRYLVKGDLRVGEAAGIAVVRIHDLNWMNGDGGSGLRILTMTASLERHFWGAAAWISKPWLTRNTAEIFLHTEWLPECPLPAGA
jgi:hypothetical protein